MRSNEGKTDEDTMCPMAIWLEIVAEKTAFHGGVDTRNMDIKKHNVRTRERFNEYKPLYGTRNMQQSPI